MTAQSMVLSQASPLARPLTAAGVGGGFVQTSDAVLYRSATNKYYVATTEPGGKYVCFEFVNNVTTTTNSLAATTSDITRFRLNQVRALLGAYLIQRTAKATSGYWAAAQNIGASDAGLGTWTSQENIQFDRSPDNAAWREYEITPINGQFNVALRCAPSSSTSVTVAVDGVTVGTISAEDATAQVKVFDFGGVGDDPITVRITNNQAANCRVIGVNFIALADYAGQTVDTLAFTQNSTTLPDYTATGAQDVVAAASDSVYGMSFHGGEASIVESFTVNGAAVSLSVGETRIGTVQIDTQASVDWGVPGSLDVSLSHKFGAGAINLTGTASGNLDALTFYSTLLGCNPAFSSLTSPVVQDLSSLANGTKFGIGNGGAMTIRHPSTGQEIRAAFSVFDASNNPYGGAYILRESGIYNKLYNGPLVETAGTVSLVRTSNTFRVSS